MSDPSKRKRRERHSGPPCPHYPKKFKTEAAHQGKLAARRRSYERKMADREPPVFESQVYPLQKRLRRLLTVIEQRCRIHPRYAGRGIKCRINYDHLLFVWVRDNAGAMRRPSIDRIDNDGDYELNNIRFTELADNIRRGIEVRDSTRRKPTAIMETA